MSILKSTKSGKSGIPLTIDYLLKQGWKWAMKKDPDNANRMIPDTSKIICDGHYLTTATAIVDIDGELLSDFVIIWIYRTYAYDYELILKTVGDYEQVAEYFKVQKQNKKQRLKEALLKRPDIKITSNLWFDNKSEDIEQPKVLTKHHEGHIKEYIGTLFTQPGSSVWVES